MVLGMTKNAYETMQPQGPLSDALDTAIAAENARYAAENPNGLADYDAEYGERWAAIAAAKATVGKHGVVLPALTARDLLAALRGDDGVLTAELLGKILERAINEAGA